MKLETFFEKFHQLADAPDAVAKMRQLVLQLAVTGKLVAQDRRDRPASALLESTEAERGRLIAAKKIKSRPISLVQPDEQPFELPSNWAWARLSDVGYELGQKVPDKRFTYIDVGGIDSDRGRISDRVEKLEPGEAPSRARKLVARGTVIYSTVRPYLLNVAIVDQDFDPEPIASTAFGILHPFEGINNRYLFYWLRGAPFTAYVLAGMKGMAYPAINDEKFYSGFIALPPLSEQNRIVAKVDELMALCDRLEAQQQERETRHAALARASLSRFADAPTPSSLNLLFHQSYDIAPVEFRKTILTLAVQGKLVPQDPSDEPAEAINSKLPKLLRAIADKVGARFTTPTATVEASEDLPPGWGTAALQSIGITQTGTTPSKSESSFTGGDIPFIKPGDIQGDVVDYDNEGLSDAGLKAGRLIPKHSVLMVSIGGSIGKTAIVNRDVSCNQQINSVTAAECVEPRFILTAIRSAGFQSEVMNRAAQGTLPIISKGKWETIRIPIPPLAEQRRIVAKLEQLMTLVDALEAQLTASRTSVANLLSALVAELTLKRKE